MHAAALAANGAWTPGPIPPAFDASDLLTTIPRFREPAHVLRESANGRVGVGLGGQIQHQAPATVNGGPASYPWLATMPALFPEWLGDRSFLEVHGVRFPYVAGAMANGIATTRLVIAMAEAGMLGFFGSAGLNIERVEKALDELDAALGSDGAPWGSNLIHSPNEPELEAAVVDLYLRRGVRRVSASAFMGLTPTVVRYAASGLSGGSDGRIQRRNHLFAKISRPEVAQRFMAPAPEDMLQALVEQGLLTRKEAHLATRLPIAEDFTVEADSGGHTDNQTLTALFPTILALRDRMTAQHGYERPIRIGAAGGLGTPSAVAAAFSLGAAYVLTGSINQAAIESGLSDDGKALLAKAELADVVMAPAADMFELGVEVQVLKRGTMFGVRAARLYELYRAYDSLEAIPADVRQRLEKEMFQGTIEDEWNSTKKFFERVDPKQIERAERDPKHRMALVFRSYLGQSSNWAIQGLPNRRMDFQIWCGPAMGAFNAWTAGTFLAEPQNRGAVQIARNLMEGAAVITRAQQLRTYGVPVPPAAFHFEPRPLA
ncbi:MAG: PfaD family polyunsaturated fatty acid/polyketide biosynthesis protein [Acidobacteriota bacterium]